MLSNLLVVAAQVGTLFLMMAVGFTLAKLNRLTKEAVPQLSFLLLYVVVPCVVVDALQTERNPELLRELGLTAIVVSASYVAYALIILPFFRRRPEATRTAACGPVRERPKFSFSRPTSRTASRPWTTCSRRVRSARRT